MPDESRCYILNFADPIFERIFREEKGFEVVEAVKEFILNYEHEEKGKNLDQKMFFFDYGRIGNSGMNKQAKS